MGDVKLDNPYVRWSLVGGLALGAWLVLEKMERAEDIATAGISQVTTSVAVLSQKLDGFAEGQRDAVATLKSIDEKMNGEREKIGNHEGRLRLLEEWRATIDRKLDGK